MCLSESISGGGSGPTNGGGFVADALLVSATGAQAGLALQAGSWADALKLALILDGQPAEARQRLELEDHPLGAHDLVGVGRNARRPPLPWSG